MRAIIIPALLGLVLLAGCGDETESTEPSAAPSVDALEPVLDLTEKEAAFREECRAFLDQCRDLVFVKIENRQRISGFKKSLMHAGQTADTLVSRIHSE